MIVVRRRPGAPGQVTIEHDSDDFVVSVEDDRCDVSAGINNDIVIKEA